MVGPPSVSARTNAPTTVPAASSANWLARARRFCRKVTAAVDGEHHSGDHQADPDLTQVDGGAKTRSRETERRGPFPDRDAARGEHEPEQGRRHAGPATAPGVSKSPGGRTSRSPCGPI